MDLALNNPQRLICHKTQRTKFYHSIDNLKYEGHSINKGNSAESIGNRSIVY